MNQKADYNVMTEGRIEGMNHLICQQVDKGCKAIHSQAETLARAFYRELASKIPGWVESYHSFHHVDNILKVKSQAKTYTEELVTSLQSYIKDETNIWANERFLPTLGKKIYALRCSVDNSQSLIQDPLGQITVNSNKDEFKDAYINMDEFTDCYCVPLKCPFVIIVFELNIFSSIVVKIK